MRHLYFLFFIIIINSCPLCAQIRANFIEPTLSPSASEIEEYRNSIWQTLPPPDGWVNDFEGIFSTPEERSISGMLQTLESKTGIEIAVVTIDSNMVSLNRFDAFADHLLHTWGVGKTDKENGILICISSQYRKIYISRGPGTDKYLSDAMIRQLILKEFFPLYKKYNYYGGTVNGISALINKIQPSIVSMR